jgi:hypothetical protein
MWSLNAYEKYKLHEYEHEDFRRVRGKECSSKWAILFSADILIVWTCNSDDSDTMCSYNIGGDVAWKTKVELERQQLTYLREMTCEDER